MDQTPIHDHHNPDLLKLIPVDVKRVIEVGCSSGALAREFKKLNRAVDWIGVEIDASYAEFAKRYCDKTLVVNVDDCPPVSLSNLLIVIVGFLGIRSNTSRTHGWC